MSWNPESKKLMVIKWSGLNKVKIGSGIERNDSRICLTLFLCKKPIYMQPLHVVGLLFSHLFFILLFFIPPPTKKRKRSSGWRKRNYYPQPWNTMKTALSYLLSFVQRRQIAALDRVLPLQGSFLPPISTNIVDSLLIEQWNERGTIASFFCGNERDVIYYWIF